MHHVILAGMPISVSKNQGRFVNGLAVSASNEGFHQALAIIEAADLADSTKAKYRRVLECYLDEGHPRTDSAMLARFASTLSNSRRAQLKAAVRLWSEAMITQAKSMATPDNINTVNATIYRFQALQTAVTSKSSNGDKAHVWLSQAEVSALMNAVTGGSNRDCRAIRSVALGVAKATTDRRGLTQSSNQPSGARWHRCAAGAARARSCR